MLRILGALHVEMPQLDRPACADQRVAHQIEHDRLRGENAGDDQDDLCAGELPGGARIQPPSPAPADRFLHPPVPPFATACLGRLTIVATASYLDTQELYRMVL